MNKKRTLINPDWTAFFLPRTMRNIAYMRKNSDLPLVLELSTIGEPRPDPVEELEDNP